MRLFDALDATKDQKAPWEEEHIARLVRNGVIRTFEDEVEFRALARGRVPWSPFFLAPRGSTARAAAEVSVSWRRVVRPIYRVLVRLARLWDKEEQR